MKDYKILKIMSTCLAVFLVISALLLPSVVTAATTGPTITVKGDSQTVVYGNTVTVSVMIEENPGFLGVNFDVKWDASVLELVNTDKTGAAFGKVEANHQSQFHKVVVTVGDPLLGIMYPDTAEQYKGTGKVATLTFKVKEGADADAVSEITLERASYVKIGGASAEDVTVKTQKIHVVATNHKHTPAVADSCAVKQNCTHCFAELTGGKHQYTNGVCAACGVKANSSKITGVSLRPGSSGLYFKGEFHLDQGTAARYGMAVSISNKLPVADGSDKGSLYTVDKEDVLIFDILGSAAKTGKDIIYVRPYVQNQDGTYIYGNVVSTSLKAVVENLDAKSFDGLNATQKTALAQMYHKYSSVMQSWQIPKIKAYA